MSSGLYRKSQGMMKISDPKTRFFLVGVISQESGVGCLTIKGGSWLLTAVFVGTQHCCVLFFSVGRDGGDRFFGHLLIQSWTH